MDATQILTRDEAMRVIADLGRKKCRNGRCNLIVFRLACCCGLRVKEIVGLNLGDVAVAGPRPAIRVRKEITTGKNGKYRSRLVPLWWDKGTLADLARWKERRIQQGATKDDPLICRQRHDAAGRRMTERECAKRWKTAIRRLGAERIAQLSIHCGRHSFATHALAIGRSLAEVRDAMGHANVSTTNVYLHYIERTGIPDLFAAPQS
jgi:integrase/recombinase XerD